MPNKLIDMARVRLVFWNRKAKRPETEMPRAACFQFWDDGYFALIS
jgi:hypothetical protein